MNGFLDRVIFSMICEWMILLANFMGAIDRKPCLDIVGAESAPLRGVEK
jgi:hypothetical protein